MPVRHTPEQKSVIDSKARLLIVRARAGTGKTTTLAGYAAARPGLRILYLAYNKAMEVAAQGKFPRNVTCKTVHAVAYRQFGRRFQDAGKLGNVRSSDVMMELGIDAMLARDALDTVNNFIYSADRQFSEAHLSHGISPQRRTQVFDKAKDLWRAMLNLRPEDGKPSVRMTHDGYLKLFQLNKPDLASQYDIILLDEAQDSNPVTADIVINQPCTRVLVGDEHQTIYGFRKSTNALESASALPGAEVAFLTQSFRFGPDIGTLATALLAGFKDEPMALLGCGPAEPLRLKVDRSKPHTVLCRTNATVFATAAECLNKRKVHFIGGTDSYPFERFLDVHNLAVGRLEAVRDPFFKKMGSLGRLQDYADGIQDVEILGLLRIQKEYGNRIPGLIHSIRRAAVDESEAEVMLTTAHRSKGLEFDQVVLADDFESFVDEGALMELDSQELVEELNLLYVAVTRAIHALEVNSSVIDALKALGSDPGFTLPPGTAPSAVVARMMGLPRLRIRADRADGRPAGHVNDESYEATAPRLKPLRAA